MTTSPDDVTHQPGTTGSVLLPTSPRGIAYYFESTIVLIGVIGTAANALILYAMVASKQHKKQVLIFNQNALDLFSSILLIVTYGAKLCAIPLTDLVGYWLCMWLLSENILWCGILASKINLFLVTIERYLKVVHRTWSKKTLRYWLIYSAAAFSWISGFALSMGITLTTTDVVDGLCFSYVFWSSWESQLAYGIWYFLFFFVLILAVFVYCYGRILLIIRRQASVMAGHSAAAASSSNQAKVNKMQASVIKTMIAVSAWYAITDLPMNVYYLLLNIHANLTLLGGGYYAVLLVSFLYICTNPFIYAVKFDPVKRVLLRLIPCVKTTGPLSENAETSANVSTRTAPAGK